MNFVNHNTRKYHPKILTKIPSQRTTTDTDSQEKTSNQVAAQEFPTNLMITRYICQLDWFGSKL